MLLSYPASTAIVSLGECFCFIQRHFTIILYHLYTTQMSWETPSIDYLNRLSWTEGLMKYSDQIQKFYFHHSHSILFWEYEALYCVYLVCGKICQIPPVLHVGGLDWSWGWGWGWGRPTILNTELCWGQGWFLYHQDSWLLVLALTSSVFFWPAPLSETQSVSQWGQLVGEDSDGAVCGGVCRDTIWRQFALIISRLIGRDAGFDMSLSRLVLHSVPAPASQDNKTPDLSYKL